MEKKRIVCALKDREKQILGFRLPLRLATACAVKLHTLRIVAFAVSGCLIGKKITLWERRPKSYTGLNQTKGFTKGYMMKLDEIFGAVDGARTRDHRRDRPVL